MEKLDEEVKLYIVERLAQFAPGWKVVAEVKERFNVVVQTQNLSVYDPKNKTAEKLSQELRDHFKESRRKFLEDRNSIPLAHPNYRLSLLQGIIDHPLLGQNPELVRAIVLDVEKIEGGMFHARISPADVIGIMRDLCDRLNASVDANVENAKERASVKAAITKLLEEQGAGSNPGGV